MALEVFQGRDGGGSGICSTLKGVTTVLDVEKLSPREGKLGDLALLPVFQGSDKHYGLWVFP